MGVGKTTVGRILARQFGMGFVDCDLELEQRTGVSVATIFEIEGEEGFRQRETRLLEELAETEGTVIATGGGAVIREENRVLLRRSGLVIYLTAPVRKLVRRTRNNRSRPLLQCDDPHAVLERLMAERDPWYREVADMVIEVDDRSPRVLGKRIQEKIDAHAHAQG